MTDESPLLFDGSKEAERKAVAELARYAEPLVERQQQDIERRKMWVFSYGAAGSDLKKRYEGFFGALPQPLQHALINYHYRKQGSIEVVKSLNDILGPDPKHPRRVGIAYRAYCNTDLARTYKPVGACHPPRSLVQYNGNGEASDTERPDASKRNDKYHEFGHQVQHDHNDRLWDGQLLKKEKRFYDIFAEAYQDDLEAAGWPDKKLKIWNYILPKADETGVISKQAWFHASREGFAEIFANQYGGGEKATDFSIFKKSAALVEQATAAFIKAHAYEDADAPEVALFKRNAKAAAFAGISRVADDLIKNPVQAPPLDKGLGAVKAHPENYTTLSTAKPNWRAPGEAPAGQSSAALAAEKMEPAATVSASAMPEKTAPPKTATDKTDSEKSGCASPSGFCHF